MRDLIYRFLFILLFFVSAVLAQEPEKLYQADSTVVVTAARVPVTYDNLARSIEVITSTEIKQLAANNVQEVLEYAASVDVRNQAANGMFADISIRGASYEQTLVMIDGFKVKDPQTGHFNFNLPISLNDVERIEILKGPGSRLYGPNAFGGVINIITKKEAEKNIVASGHYGEDALFNGALSIAQPTGKLQNRATFAYDRSDGYRPNTDFKNINASYRGRLEHNNIALDLNFGHADKEFGANQFYGVESGALQWEENQTTFASAKLNSTHKNFHFTNGLYWRQNHDHYVWNREDTSKTKFQNFHTTNVYGFESQMNYSSSLGVFTFGGEAAHETIESINLSDHNRTRTGLFFEHQFQFFEKLNLNAGASVYYYSDWGWQAWPGADLGFKINNNHKLFVSYGQAFRVPTYTELFYSGPGNRGNADLNVENNKTAELGYLYRHSQLTTGFNVFKRWSDDVIDWVRPDEESDWQTENIPNLNTLGFEAEFQLGRRLRFAYTYLDSERSLKGLSSKYAIEHFTNQIVAMYKHNWFTPRLTQSLQLRYQDRLQFDSQFLLDTRLRWQTKNVTLSLDVTNILNTDYNEFLYIPMPGRKFRVGASYKLY